MLFLVGTPIGNLGDITYRAVQTLQTADYILCEDTRHSASLCRHYQIEAPLKSYHLFNESKQEQKVIDDLKSGLNIALISDAGMPGICDPGQQLVNRCRQEEIKVSVIPGPSAFVSALCGSGIEIDSFCFSGFLSRKSGQLNKELARVLVDERTHLFYETPHRIEKTVEAIAQVAPQRKLCIARELTKLHEEFLHGTAAQLHDRLLTHPIKGEIVLIIAHDPHFLPASWHQMEGAEHVRWLQSQFNIEKSEALKLAAHLRGCPKNELYNQLI